MHWNIPNILSMLRIVAIPLVVAVYLLDIRNAGPIAALIFGAACITDWFDGYLARKLNQTSRFGAFIDPVADKLIVAVSLVLLVHIFDNYWLTISAIIIISREITISALREWMAEVGQRSNVAVSYIGKIKTTFQMFAIFFLLWREPLLGIDVVTIGLVLLVIAAALTLYSMIIYLRAAFASDAA